MRVGFIGLGSLGRHLALSASRAGYELTVHDRDPSATRVLVEAGAAAAGSPAEVARACETVVTCLPSARAVTEVVSGADGVLAGLAAGGTWIDTSTGDRHELQRLAALAAAQGVATLECPVTGGVHRAAAGDITVIVGGDEGVLATQRDLLQAIGGEVIHVGPLGSASVIKVVTNLLAFVHVVAVGEALMLARRAGLDLARSFEVIRASSGNSFVHETESRLVLNGSYDIGFTMELALKDLGLAHGLGRELGVPLELGGLVEQVFVRAREQYGADAPSTMVVKLLEDALGTDLRAPGFPARLEP